MEVGGQRHVPATLLPGKTRYPLYRRQGGPQGRSGRVRKISSPPGFDPRTMEPIISRYTVWANQTHCLDQKFAQFISVLLFKALYEKNYKRKKNTELR